MSHSGAPQVIDLGSIKPADVKVITQAAKSLWTCTPPNASELASLPQQKALDEAFLAAIGLPKSRVTELHDQVSHFAQVRRSLQVGKGEALKATTTVDVQAMTKEASESLRSWLEARRFPEDFCSTEDTLAFGLGELEVTSQVVMTSCNLTVKSAAGTLLDSDYDTATAEVIVRALQLGRRDFSVPESEEEAERALKALVQVVEELANQFQLAMAEASVGSKYENQIRSRALRILGIELDDLEEPFAGKSTWKISS